MASDAGLTARVRAGLPITRAMKIATLSSRREIEGFLWGVAEFDPPLDSEEQVAIDRQWRRATGMARRV